MVIKQLMIWKTCKILLSLVRVVGLLDYMENKLILTQHSGHLAEKRRTELGNNLFSA